MFCRIRRVFCRIRRVFGGVRRVSRRVTVAVLWVRISSQVLRLEGRSVLGNVFLRAYVVKQVFNVSHKRGAIGSVYLIVHVIFNGLPMHVRPLKLNGSLVRSNLSASLKSLADCALASVFPALAV